MVEWSVAGDVLYTTTTPGVHDGGHLQNCFNELEGLKFAIFLSLIYI